MAEKFRFQLLSQPPPPLGFVDKEAGVLSKTKTDWRNLVKGIAGDVVEFLRFCLLLTTTVGP